MESYRYVRCSVTHNFRDGEVQARFVVLIPNGSKWAQWHTFALLSCLCIVFLPLASTCTKQNTKLHKIAQEEPVTHHYSNSKGV